MRTDSLSTTVDYKSASVMPVLLVAGTHFLISHRARFILYSSYSVLPFISPWISSHSDACRMVSMTTPPSPERE